MWFISFVFILAVLSGGSTFCANEGGQGGSYAVYQQAVAAFEQKDWALFEQHAEVVLQTAPSSFQEEILYLMGCRYFEVSQWEKANEFFTQYVSSSPAPKHFSTVMEYKYKIAQSLRKELGAFSVQKWWKRKTLVSGVESLLNEVISSLPKHDLCAQALYAKALFLEERGCCKASAEAFRLLIQRFPKHSCAADSFLGLGRIYLKQSQGESPDEHLLELAHLNMKNYAVAFPQGEGGETLQHLYDEMEQIFASKLLVAAQFFQKHDQQEAARMYVKKILLLYPNTPASKAAQEIVASRQVLPADKNGKKK